MMSMSRLSNKVAILTGASKGIGGGIATALGAEGARVAVNYSSDRSRSHRPDAPGFLSTASDLLLNGDCSTKMRRLVPDFPNFQRAAPAISLRAT